MMLIAKMRLTHLGRARSNGTDSINSQIPKGAAKMNAVPLVRMAKPKAPAAKNSLSARCSRRHSITGRRRRAAKKTLHSHFVCWSFEEFPSVKLQRTVSLVERQLRAHRATGTRQ